MDGSKLSLIIVFMVSAVAARLIPNGDNDKEHNSDDQERLDRQDYLIPNYDEGDDIVYPEQNPNDEVKETFKPAILATGICAHSPSQPCCKATIEIYEILSRPDVPADLSYPNCRDDGYYAGKQCQWFGCHCVDPNGNSVEGTEGTHNFNIICPVTEYEYEVEPADKLLTSEEIDNLPDLPEKEDPETAGKTIDELIGGGDDIVDHY